MATRQCMLTGLVLCGFAIITVVNTQDPENVEHEAKGAAGDWKQEHALDDLFPSEAEAKASAANVSAVWKKVRDTPADVFKVDIVISKSRHDIGHFDIFTDRDIKFETTINLPESRGGVLRKIAGALGPCYGSYYISGPPDTNVGKLSFFSKSSEEPVVVLVTNSGFYLGDEQDPRLKFHSWYLARLVNDAALAQGTSLTQISFDHLCGSSRIVFDQWHELKFDKKKYKNRPANVWNLMVE